jgi:hypothetical protein
MGRPTSRPRWGVGAGGLGWGRRRGLRAQGQAPGFRTSGGESGSIRRPRRGANAPGQLLTPPPRRTAPACPASQQCCAASPRCGPPSASASSRRCGPGQGAAAGQGLGSGARAKGTACKPESLARKKTFRTLSVAATPPYHQPLAPSCLRPPPLPPQAADTLEQLRSISEREEGGAAAGGGITAQQLAGARGRARGTRVGLACSRRRERGTVSADHRTPPPHTHLRRRAGCSSRRAHGALRRRTRRLRRRAQVPAAVGGQRGTAGGGAARQGGG